MTEKYEELLEKALKNVDSDRLAANTALDEVCQDIHNGKVTHDRVGVVVAKYLETLQRSNEQLVKVASLMAKTNKDNNVISGEELDAIYNNLNEYKDEEKDGE
jgi:hypothetical protein